MENEVNFFKRGQAMMTIAIIVGIVSLFLSIAKNIVTETWALRRENVACIPAGVEHTHPFVYRQTAMHPTEQDALLKTFISDYIHLTLDEQIVDYHTVSNQSRYKDARIKQALTAAMNMSLGEEKALNMTRFAESNEVYYRLKKSNMGWIFLIDDILVFGVPHSGSVFAVVRGEFQATYDKIKVDLPAKLWGYREVWLVLNQGTPMKNTADEYENKYGWFVTWSSMQTLTPEQKSKLDKRSYDYYLLNDTK